MEEVLIKVEPDVEEQVNATENAMKIKVEPEDGELSTSCMNLQEEDEGERSDTLICGWPAPDSDNSNHEQPQDNIEPSSSKTPSPNLKKFLQFECEHCLKRYKTRNKLNRHVYTLHSEKHYCDVCGKCFAVKSNAKRHLLSHSSDPQFECLECHKKYRSRTGLHYHLRTIHHWV